ncbi:heavy metal response regulator transcription factor [Comamonas piscis]|uniref:Heavy metal response regulator transcription factor n=1 Tax=Comamonas piscis TaxID=1562974 RepID=A0A7G5EPA3_9BURK|nr:heavy metal response regulator transcription factor [Comamonas piscis]QMV75828.1 heavy metal response regulator transcription factor [Comamonas piscis]WSO36377.1 heavy metal response regulator transcription factor [Comamonas piscis]
MRILIIEDEIKSAEYLKKGLGDSGFQVEVANDGIDGLFIAQSNDFDLLILDVMLPGIDGWGVIRRFRERSQVPVLFLTARDAVEDRVKGLELGADDYLIKPFSYAELLARVRTLLRRTPMRQQDIVEMADLEVDMRKRRALRGGQRIDLTNQEFALLQLLLQHQGEVLSRSQIASQVWDMNFDSDTNVVDVAIRRLRAKIDDAFAVKLIQTVRGMGYRIEAPLP